MMFYGNGDWSFWEVALMAVAMIAFWGLLIWGAYAVITGAKRPTNELGGDPARRILDERFAKGDINEEEYTRRRELLHSTTVRS
jgi:putative membrane protein